MVPVRSERPRPTGWAGAPEWVLGRSPSRSERVRQESPRTGRRPVSPSSSAVDPMRVLAAPGSARRGPWASLGACPGVPWSNRGRRAGSSRRPASLASTSSVPMEGWPRPPGSAAEARPRGIRSTSKLLARLRAGSSRRPASLASTSSVPMEGWPRPPGSAAEARPRGIRSTSKLLARLRAGSWRRPTSPEARAAVPNSPRTVPVRRGGCATPRLGAFRRVLPQQWREVRRESIPNPCVPDLTIAPRR
jgi:hypothetical protein